MKLRYSYIQQIGINEHCIELYKDWSRDEGLIGKPEKRIYKTRFNELKKEIKPLITESQYSLLKLSETNGSYHWVIAEDGTTLELS